MIWNIVSDSSCDLPVSEFHSDSILFHSVPLRIRVGEQEFVDDDALEVPEMLAAMAAEKSASSSSCPSPADFARAFEAGDCTVCFTISSQLSGTYHRHLQVRLFLPDHGAQPHQALRIFLVGQSAHINQVKIIAVGILAEFFLNLLHIYNIVQHTALSSKQPVKRIPLIRTSGNPENMLCLPAGIEISH